MNEACYPLVALREVATDIRDGSHATHPRVAEGNLFLSAKNIGENGKLVLGDSEDQIDNFQYNLINSAFAPRLNDLLVTIVGTVGRRALFDGSKAAFQRSVAFVRPSDAVVPDYLFHAAGDALFTRQLHRRSNVTAQAGLYLGELAKVKIPLPDKKTQRRIATILTTLDEVIEATEKLVEKHQQIKAGLMHDLFTRGLWTRPELARGDHKGTPAEATAQEGQLRPTPEEAPKLYQDSPLGLIPKAWKIQPLDSVGEIVTGNTPSENAFENGSRGVPFVTPGDVGEGVFVEATERSLININADRTRPIPAHSVCVVCIGSTIGKLAMIGRESVTNQQINTVVSRDPKAAYFNYFSICNFLPNQLRREAGLQAVPIVNKSTFARLLISTPRDQGERESIQNRLLASSANIEATTTHLAKLRQQKQGLMHDLLTGRVRAE